MHTLTHARTLSPTGPVQTRLQRSGSLWAVEKTHRVRRRCEHSQRRRGNGSVFPIRVVNTVHHSRSPALAWGRDQPMDTWRSWSSGSVRVPRRTRTLSECRGPDGASGRRLHLCPRTFLQRSVTRYPRICSLHTKRGSPVPAGVLRAGSGLRAPLKLQRPGCPGCGQTSEGCRKRPTSVPGHCSLARGHLPTSC
uniref:Uncharacterized protein n=1 Tax=Molossus molossus TaxID=27622 RepID=A0A7J8FSI6_MOLMO|nr:hypothetical protein HJG59_008409 [Molossus molossus]